jgi:hypothetical protein
MPNLINKLWRIFAFLWEIMGKSYLGRKIFPIVTENVKRCVSKKHMYALLLHEWLLSISE